MKKLTILLPAEDTEKHILVAVRKSKFAIPDAYTETMDFSWSKETRGADFTQNRVYLSSGGEERSHRKSNNSKETLIGSYAVLPIRDNSAIVFIPEESDNTGMLDEFSELIKQHFKDLDLLIENRAEPWRKSPIDKQERDKDIWELRNSGETWERTAELARCGVTTAKERYQVMQRVLDDD